MKAVNLVLGEANTKKMQHVSLSNNTIQRRISKMSMDEIKASPLFSFQLDESTDVSSCSQWFVLVIYINSGDIKYKFCSAVLLKPQQKLMMSWKKFFQDEDLQWENVCGICTDGAPAMLGSKS